MTAKLSRENCCLGRKIFMTEKPNERRLGLRIDAKLKLRLKQAAVQAEADALKGEVETGAVSVKSLTEDAIRFYLDYLDGKGDELLLAVKEIMTTGSEATRRRLRNAVTQCLEEARATVGRQSKQVS